MPTVPPSSKSAIVLVFGYPVRTALTVSASLAQIGEFSFILAGLGVALGLLPAEGRDLILAGALLSIMLNPLAFSAVDPLVAWFEGKPGLRARIERSGGGNVVRRSVRPSRSGWAAHRDRPVSMAGARRVPSSPTA